MVQKWGADTNRCDEFNCGAALSKGSRHHCRQCGKQICGEHSKFATVANYTPQFEDPDSGVFKAVSGFLGSNSEKRICDTCAIKYNLVEPIVTKRFVDTQSCDRWIKETFPVRTGTNPIRTDERFAYPDVSRYVGIVYRNDDYLGYEGIFRHGFMQRFDVNPNAQNPMENVAALKRFSNFLGRDIVGHTGRFGISCTKSFEYAYNWNNGPIYAIDLSAHPFAIDISETVRIRIQHNHPKQYVGFRQRIEGSDNPNDLNDDVQFEVNAANHIESKQVIGCFIKGAQIVFIKNPRYEPNYG